jgi:hypothetical protein
VRCGSGGVRRRATKAAAAACGGGVWLLSPQLPGGAYNLALGGGGDEHGAEALRVVFLPESLFSVSHRPYTTMRRDDRRRVA